MAKTLVDLDVQAKLASATNQIIASSAIDNSKVSASAAIDFSKLAALTSGNILVGNGSNVATSVAVSGDITLSNAGVAAIASGVIVNADVNASAAIDFSKLATLADGNILVGSAGGVATSVNPSGDIDISNAGVFSINAGVIVDADINASAAIALSKLAEAVIQADGGQAFTAAQSMGGFKLTNLANGTVSADAVNYGQLLSLSSGLAWKAPARCATINDLETATSKTWIANNGTPATGEFTYNTTTKTLTWFASEGPTTIDGVTLANGNRILVKAESGSSGPAGGSGLPYMGIYERTSQDVWTRASDSDESAEFEAQAVFVKEGTVEANRGYTQTADSVTMDTTALNYSLFTATNGDANTLDGLDSLQFLRSDANDSVTTGVTLNIDSGATLSIDGTWDIGGTAVTSNATELNLLDGLTGTIWTSTNDGAGSGLDADLLDALNSTAFLRATASSAVATGNTLNIDSGATLSIDGTWDIGGTAVTATAAHLNALGTIAIREIPSGAINGSNAVYTLANTPKVGSEEVFLNGVLQQSGGEDYSISSGTITFVSAPTTGSRILVSYRY